MFCYIIMLLNYIHNIFFFFPFSIFFFFFHFSEHDNPSIQFFNRKGEIKCYNEGLKWSFSSPSSTLTTFILEYSFFAWSRSVQFISIRLSEWYDIKLHLSVLWGKEWVEYFVYNFKYNYPIRITNKQKSSIPRVWKELKCGFYESL